MTDLTASKKRDFQEPIHEQHVAAAQVYAGMALQENVDGAKTVQALTGTGTFLGFALNDAEAGECVNVVVQGVVDLPVTGSGSSDPGTAVYATDSDTFTMTSTDAAKIGSLRRQSAAASTTWEVFIQAVGRQGQAA